MLQSDPLQQGEKNILGATVSDKTVSHLTLYVLNFSQLRLFLFASPAKSLWSSVPVTLTYKYRRLVILEKLPEEVYDS